MGGPPQSVIPNNIKIARQMYGSREHTVEAIAKTLGVSRKSIYRHLDRQTYMTEGGN